MAPVVLTSTTPAAAAQPVTTTRLAYDSAMISKQDFFNEIQDEFEKLLNSIANDLDLMLNDLCKTFPYPGTGGQNHTCPVPPTSETGLFEQYVGGAVDDDDDEEDGDASSESSEGLRDFGHIRNYNSDRLDILALEEDAKIPLPTPSGSIGGGTPPPLLVRGQRPDDNSRVPCSPFSMLEVLVKTHPIWYLPNISRAGTVHLLQDRTPGSFIVRQSSKKNTMALSVKLPSSTEPTVDHYLIEYTNRGLRLEGSDHHFTAIPLLIAHYSQKLPEERDDRDELPCQLVLPAAVMQARTSQELTSLALLGHDFWTSSLNTLRLPDSNKVFNRSLINGNLHQDNNFNGQSKVTINNHMTTVSSQSLKTSSSGSQSMKTSTSGSQSLKTSTISSQSHKSTISSQSQTSSTFSSSQDTSSLSNKSLDIRDLHHRMKQITEVKSQSQKTSSILSQSNHEVITSCQSQKTVISQSEMIQINNQSNLQCSAAPRSPKAIKAPQPVLVNGNSQSQTLSPPSTTVPSISPPLLGTQENILERKHSSAFSSPLRNRDSGSGDCRSIGSNDGFNSLPNSPKTNHSRFSTTSSSGAVHDYNTGGSSGTARSCGTGGSSGAGSLSGATWRSELQTVINVPSSPNYLSKSSTMLSPNHTGKSVTNMTLTCTAPLDTLSQSSDEAPPVPEKLLQTPDAPYYKGSLADRLSDYEDIWTPTPPSMANQKLYYKNTDPKTNHDGKTPVKMNGSDEHTHIELKPIRLSFINPGYHSDSSSEWGTLQKSGFSEDPNFRIDVSLDRTEKTDVDVQAKVIKNMAAERTEVPPFPVQETDRPDVFNFDFVRDAEKKISPPPPEIVAPSSPPQTPPPPPERGPGSASSWGKFSSPGYMEPFDSLIGLVDGVEKPHGAIRAKDSIRMKQQENLSANHYKIAPPPKVVSKRRPVQAVQANNAVKKELAQDNHDDVEVISSPSIMSFRESCAGPAPARWDGYEVPLESQSVGSESNSSKVRLRRKPPPDPNRPLSIPNKSLGSRKSHRSLHREDNLIDLETEIPNHIPLSDGTVLTLADLERLSRNFETLPKFPVAKNQLLECSNRTSFSECSTIEELISERSPELTLKPIKPLTLRNVQRISEYDNVRLEAVRGSGMNPASSVGTIFSKPWDSTLWDDLLNLGGTSHQPRYRLPPGVRPASEYVDHSQHEIQTVSETVTSTEMSRVECSVPPPVSRQSYSPQHSSFQSPSHSQRSHSHPRCSPPPVAPSISTPVPNLAPANAKEELIHGSDRSDSFVLLDGSTLDRHSRTSDEWEYIRGEGGHDSGDDRAISISDQYFPLMADVPDVTDVDPGSVMSERDNVSEYEHERHHDGKNPPDLVLRNLQDAAQQSFKEKIMSLLSTPRLISLRNRGKDPGIRIRNFIYKLSMDRNTTFGATVNNFIQCTKDSLESNPHVTMRNTRQFMNGIKNYLVQHGEHMLNDLIERERSKLKADEFLNVDAIIEGALHKCVIRPLKQHLCKMFVDEYTRNGNLEVLSNNIKYARTKTPEEMGIKPEFIPPQGTSMEVIKHFLTKMQKAYSPLKKLENLLGATSSIYNSVQSSQSSQGREVISMGADDFLPMFIYVLVHCGLVAAEIEADYMWGLLHPSLLAGEGGYYLTTLSSAVHVLKNFTESQESLEIQTRATRVPSISDMQGFMKIIIPDEKNDSIITKTLPVRPNMTTKDVCSMIAHKFKITNPQDYGLYQLDDGRETQFLDNDTPQNTKCEHVSQGKECTFAYHRINARFAWPSALSS